MSAVTGKHTVVSTTNVTGTGSFDAMSDDAIDALDELSDHLGFIAPSLQAKLVLKMRREGASGRAGLFGTTEAKAAKEVCDPIAQAAEWCAWAADAMRTAQKKMGTEILLPIQQAEELMRGDDPFNIDE